MPESRVHVRVHTEEIEVTRDGTLPPFKADVARKFIPGLTTFFVTIDGEELPPMTPIEFMQLTVEINEVFQQAGRLAR